ncbi:polysaccharide deacetylase family protein [Deltaproteobacteria bacterium]|nr:polysaccharide deacetylase family protein [Deltaproteobacteria bacterium]
MNKFQSKYYIAKLISTILRGLITSNGCRILLYHSLNSVVDGDVNGIYQMNKESFQIQMDYLTNLKKSIIPLIEWSLNQETVVITFDDGFLDTLQIAAPILVKHNMPFTVFVSPNLIKSKDQRYLEKASLLELSKIDGCTIGAHGDSHCELTKCTNQKLLNELQSSKKWLEDELSIPVNTMSYPHGAVDQRVRDAVCDAGYTIALSSRSGVNHPDSDPLWLNRTDVWSNDNMKVFDQKVKGYWDWMRWIN